MQLLRKKGTLSPNALGLQMMFAYQPLGQLSIKGDSHDNSEEIDTYSHRVACACC